MQPCSPLVGTSQEGGHRVHGLLSLSPPCQVAAAATEWGSTGHSLAGFLAPELCSLLLPATPAP